MANFSYVTWTNRTPVTSARLLQMSENDQYLQDEITSAGTGAVLWATKANTFSLDTTEKTVMTTESVYSFNTTSLYKFTFRYDALYCSNGAANVTLKIKAGASSPTVTVARSVIRLTGTSFFEAQPVIGFYKMTTEGTKHVAVTAQLSTSTGIIGSSSGLDMALVVEDMGTAPSQVVL